MNAPCWDAAPLLNAPKKLALCVWLFMKMEMMLPPSPGFHAMRTSYSSLRTRLSRLPTWPFEPWVEYHSVQIPTFSVIGPVQSHAKLENGLLATGLASGSVTAGLLAGLDCWNRFDRM